MSVTTDRRVRRTRALLHRSLLALIQEKRYGRITVQDILDRADVGRSTFYSHYRDKDDLLLGGGADHLHALLAAGHDPDPPGVTRLLPQARALFRLVDRNRPLYRAMIGNRGGEPVVRRARTMLADVIAEHLRARLPAYDPRQVDLTATFLVSGLFGLLTWWLDEQVPLCPDQMYERFEDLASRIVESPPPPTTPPRSLTDGCAGEEP